MFMLDNNYVKTISSFQNVTGAENKSSKVFMQIRIITAKLLSHRADFCLLQLNIILNNYSL